MKNIKSYLGKLLVLLTFTIIINSITYAQHKIYGKEIKSITWKGKAVEYVDGELAIKLKKGFSKVNLNSVLSKYQHNIKQDFDEFGWGWI